MTTIRDLQERFPDVFTKPTPPAAPREPVHQGPARSDAMIASALNERHRRHLEGLLSRSGDRLEIVNGRPLLITNTLGETRQAQR